MKVRSTVATEAVCHIPHQNIDRCLMVAILRDRFLLSKKAAQKLDVERYFLNKLREVEFTEHYRIQISYRFAALDNFRKCLSN